MPLYVIIAGVLLVISVLIWQIASQTQSASQSPTNAQTQENLPYPEVARISLLESKRAFDNQSAVFLDVRDAGSFSKGHIPGAINIPLNELEQRYNEIASDQSIITYCTWPDEQSSARAALILFEKGYDNVEAIRGGLAAWQQAGYPIEWV